MRIHLRNAVNPNPMRTFCSRGQGPLTSNPWEVTCGNCRRQLKADHRRATQSAMKRLRQAHPEEWQELFAQELYRGARSLLTINYEAWAAA